MHVLIAGATGFLGTAWSRSLRAEGHQVTTLVRRPPTTADQQQWDPYADDPAAALDRGLVESADVVANLAGAPLAHWPWTDSYKQTFAASRVRTTQVLAEAVASSDRRPVLVAQSGVASYGDRGDDLITEHTPTDGDGFLAEVTRQWEAATHPAVAAGARVVVLRTGVVLDRDGGALRSLLPAYRLGLGGPIGGGDQQFATISLADWVSVATWGAVTDAAHGAYNVVGPGTTSNRDFSQELARQLHRPSVLKVPALPLRRLGGVAGNELLSSARVEPTRLRDEAFTFAHPDLPSRVRAALHAG